MSDLEYGTPNPVLSGPNPGEIYLPDYPHREIAESPIYLPENVAAFRPDAANTNEKPIYIGNLMLFSDQDLTSLKHNLVYTAVVSTVFVGLIHTISNDQIPLVWRSVMLGVILTGLHSACIALWNITQSTMQIHPSCSPAGIWHWLTASPWRALPAFSVLAYCVFTYGPMVADSFVHSIRVMGVLG